MKSFLSAVGGGGGGGALGQTMRSSHSRQWEALEGDDGSAPIEALCLAYSLGLS